MMNRYNRLSNKNIFELAFGHEICRKKVQDRLMRGSSIRGGVLQPEGVNVEEGAAYRRARKRFCWGGTGSYA